MIAWNEQLRLLRIVNTVHTQDCKIFTRSLLCRIAI